MTDDPNGAAAEAAERLLTAGRTGTPCSPIRDLCPVDDISTAYAIQELQTKSSLDLGRRLVGRKIGLTSEAVQKQLGVDQPDYGMLFADMNAPQGLPISVDAVMQPKIEAEVAFVLGDDLDSKQLTTADVLHAIDFAMASLEIVGSRVENWDITIVDTIADNGSAGLFVLGDAPRLITEVDVVACEMQMIRNGNDQVSQGTGAACLGSPITSTLWLAQEMVRCGRPLKSGDIVLSGALGPMVAVNPGDVFVASITGLGSVSATFEGE